MPRHAALLIPLLLAACDVLPRDVDGTSERILRSHAIRVGVTGPPDAAGERFLARIADETNAKVVREEHSLEPLLTKLEDGRLDLVVAPFAADTLWADRVALSPPLDGTQQGDRPLAQRAAARNGEHRWVMQIERIARAGG